LLERINFDPAADKLLFVGDLVNRGPMSLQVLRLLQGLSGVLQVVLGNHDLHLLMLAAGYGQSNKDDTLAELLQADDAPQLLSWLRQWPLCYRVDEQTLMVHAGLLPMWSAEQALSLSAEIEQVLQTAEQEKYHQFMANMMGPLPDCWHENLTGWARLRVIVNAMTRLRFINQQGKMILKALGSKGPPEKAPKEFIPWFNAANRQTRSHRIICGHWSALGLLVRKDVVALDSGCFWGGALTALRLEDGVVFQQPC